MTAPPPFPNAERFLAALPLPMLLVGPEGGVIAANAAAESFFDMSAAVLCRHTLAQLLPAGSPLLALAGQVARDRQAVNEYRLDLTPPRGAERIVDVHVAPAPDSAQNVFILLQERTIADKLDRQLTHRGAARSVSAMAAMLAHEIKNPLSGIRGAAQLLDGAVSDADRPLTQLICDETDRIVKLVDRMEVFSDARPLARESFNIHAVLDHVRRVAEAGFARHIRFREVYDPSLPEVSADRDQLVQVFLNLVKNAAESIGGETVDGEIELTTAYKPGVRMKAAGAARPVRVPLEICVRDNGPGVPGELAARLFDPFVTTKASGSGLGLALVAKIVGDHGGIVECESHPRRTTFRVLLPLSAPPGAAAIETSPPPRGGATRP
jgi:two-component system nitrogen regulation sensor histidine kinase GlnL